MTNPHSWLRIMVVDQAGKTAQWDWRWAPARRSSALETRQPQAGRQCHCQHSPAERRLARRSARHCDASGRSHGRRSRRAQYSGIKRRFSDERQDLRCCVLAAATFAVPAFAHHSFAMFDQEKTITLKGTVKEFEWNNPHVWMRIMVMDQATESRCNTRWKWARRALDL